MTAEASTPAPHESARIDWGRVGRVLIVKLRSIGDTVLATPSLDAFRRFLPEAKIDILLEDWVAPLLEGHPSVDEVISVGRDLADRLAVARELRRRRYDVAFNLHGGATATFFVRASGARHRVGYRSYRYSFLYDRLLASAEDFWRRGGLHSVERQLALLGFVGVPMDDLPPSSLPITEAGLSDRVRQWHERGSYAVLHPATAFFTKQWPVENFARTAEHLAEKGLDVIALASAGEADILAQLKAAVHADITTFDDLSLPEITALLSRAEIFVGNDSGIAHISAAVRCRTVVAFGSSNREHWRPWTDAPSEAVFVPFSCQPCAGYECKEYGDAPCILTVSPAAVNTAIDRILPMPRS